MNLVGIKKYTMKNCFNWLTFVALMTISVISITSCSKNDCSEPTVEPYGDCICIQIYDPVCGCDGKTYSNNCHAHCEGVAIKKKGECN